MSLERHAARTERCSGARRFGITVVHQCVASRESLYEELCVGNTDKVLRESSLSGIGIADYSVPDKIAAIKDTTAEGADDWYSTTSMTMGDAQRQALEVSIDTVLQASPNRSNFTITTYGSDPNDPATHAWCLSE